MSTTFKAKIKVCKVGATKLSIMGLTSSLSIAIVLCTECCTFIAILIVIMLNVIMLSVVPLCIIMTKRQGTKHVT